MTKPCHSHALVAGIITGDPKSVEEFFARFYSGSRYVLLRALGPHDVDDHLHTCMLRCIEFVQHKGMREPERLTGLVATVCQRYIWAEYSRRAMEREAVNVEMIQIPAAGPDINETLGRSRALAAATTALAELSEKEREVLVRFYIEDQDKEQICAAMQLDSVQFRNLKHRAKQKLGERGRRILHSRPLLPLPQPTSGRVAAVLG